MPRPIQSIGGSPGLKTGSGERRSWVRAQPLRQSVFYDADPPSQPKTLLLRGFIVIGGRRALPPTVTVRIRPRLQPRRSGRMRSRDDNAVRVRDHGNNRRMGGRKSRTVSRTVRQRRRFGCPHSPLARRAFRYKGACRSCRATKALTIPGTVRSLSRRRVVSLEVRVKGDCSLRRRAAEYRYWERERGLSIASIHARMSADNWTTWNPEEANKLLRAVLVEIEALAEQLSPARLRLSAVRLRTDAAKRFKKVANGRLRLPAH